MDTIIKTTIRDADGETEGTQEIEIVPKDDGILIRPKGYGDNMSANGFGYPILLERFNGKLRLLLWANINQEDITHKINLERAKESRRKPQ